MDLEAARAFIREHPRAVMATRRRDGGVQMTPVLAAVDEAGRLAISSRETALKVRNLRRDPKTWLCFLVEGFFGSFVQVEGTADIVSLPEAMEHLVDYYRRLAGEHPDWDDYRRAMERERRVLVRVSIERAGPDRSG